MTIARLIQGRSSEVLSCTAETSVRDAISLLAEKRIGALPVFAGADPKMAIVGIFSERDVVYGLQRQGPAFLDRNVGEVMTVEPDTPVLEALGLMTRRRVRHLPVERNGEVVAFVSIGDLVKYRIDGIQSEAEALRTYIQSV